MARAARDPGNRGSRRAAPFHQRQLKDPEGFVDRVERIHAESPEESYDVLEFADGRVIERFSKIQFVDNRKTGRVWSFRDVTERRRTERSLVEETRVLEMLNRTGMMLAAELDLQSLLQSVTDAATQLSGARFGAFFYNASGTAGESYVLSTLSGVPREAFEASACRAPRRCSGPRSLARRRCAATTSWPIPRYGRMAPASRPARGHLPVRSYLAVPGAGALGRR